MITWRAVLFGTLIWIGFIVVCGALLWVVDTTLDFVFSLF